MRTCTKCGKVSNDYCFATYKKKNGITARRNICKECRNKYQQENFDKLQEYRKTYNRRKRSEKREKDIKRREEIKSVIDELKSKTPCKDCGQYFPPVAMDFDHVKGKNKAISSLVSGAYRLELILEEIKLCELVCACCHRVRTHKRKENLSISKQERIV